jgi:molybdenum cofactor cytidylyltransferase
VPWVSDHAFSARPNDSRARIAGVVLAAGDSSRMGRPKQLLKYDCVSLLRRTALAAVESGLDPLVVALGANSSLLVDDIQDLPLQIVVNDRWESGLGSSIRTGVGAIRSVELDAVAILLSDQPFVTSALIRRLIEAYLSSDAPIVASRYANTLGVPALFDRMLLPSLAEIPDDGGAKHLIASVGDAVIAVDFPEGAWDLDTPEDYERLIARNE